MHQLHAWCTFLHGRSINPQQVDRVVVSILGVRICCVKMYVYTKNMHPNPIQQVPTLVQVVM
jgi:hypothetical protein